MQTKDRVNIYSRCISILFVNSFKYSFEAWVSTVRNSGNAFGEQLNKNDRLHRAWIQYNRKLKTNKQCNFLDNYMCKEKKIKKNTNSCLLISLEKWFQDTLPSPTSSHKYQIYPKE